MPISQTKKAVFVHIPKTAGTTIEKAMGMQNNESLFSLKYDDRYKVCLQHLYHYEIKQLHPETENYYWFSVVRNPLHRLISAYNHYTTTNGTRTNEFKNCSFKEFTNCLDLPESDRKFLFDRHLELQVNFIDKSVEVFKFEQLSNCFNVLKQKFNVPFFTHERKGFVVNLSDFYDKYTLDKVLDFYQKDFDAFDYKLNN